MATPNIAITNARPSPAAHTAARTVRTLVVDDSPAILATLTALLSTDPRVEVVGTASNGLAAVALAQRTKPDFILMDVNMPQMNGLKAAMHIKRRLPATRIILTSADHDPEVALAAIDCGADGFVPKNRWARYAWHLDRLFFSL